MQTKCLNAANHGLGMNHFEHNVKANYKVSGHQDLNLIKVRINESLQQPEIVKKKKGHIKLSHTYGLLHGAPVFK